MNNNFEPLKQISMWLAALVAGGMLDEETAVDMILSAKRIMQEAVEQGVNGELVDRGAKAASAILSAVNAAVRSER